MSVTALERWLDKREVAAHFGFSVRTWERKTRGYEPTEIFGRPRYKASEAESWLIDHGLIRRAEQ